MSRFNILLLMIVIMCALSVVDATNQQRQIFIDLERAQGQERQLQQDYAQLQYQQSALSKTSRVENVATSELKMQSVSSGRTQYIVVNPASVPLADAPVSAAAASAPQPGAAR